MASTTKMYSDTLQELEPRQIPTAPGSTEQVSVPALSLLNHVDRFFRQIAHFIMCLHAWLGLYMLLALLGLLAPAILDSRTALQLMKFLVAGITLLINTSMLFIHVVVHFIVDLVRGDTSITDAWNALDQACAAVIDVICEMQSRREIRVSTLSRLGRVKHVRQRRSQIIFHIDGRAREDLRDVK